MPRTPRPRHRAFAVGAALAAAGLVLAACAGGEEPDGSGPGDSVSHGDLTVQLSWILDQEWSGELIAQDEGYYRDAGLSSVNLVPGPSSGVPELLSGTAQISLTDALSVGAAVANEGAPLKILGATYQKNPFTIASLEDGADIASPADMVGMRIGVQDSNRAVFAALLAANDLDESDVEIVPVQYDPSPLVNGEVDGLIAFVTSQSVALELSGLAVTDLLFADNGLPFVGHVVTATDETIASERDMIKAFLAAEIRGWTAALADPAKGAMLAVDEYGADLDLDAEIAVASAAAQNELLIESEETDRNGIFTVSADLAEQTVRSLVVSGFEVSVADLFDLSLLDEVYAENPDLIGAAR